MMLLVSDVIHSAHCGRAMTSSCGILAEVLLMSWMKHTDVKSVIWFLKWKIPIPERCACNFSMLSMETNVIGTKYFVN